MFYLSWDFLRGRRRRFFGRSLRQFWKGGGKPRITSRCAGLGSLRGYVLPKGITFQYEEKEEKTQFPFLKPWRTCVRDHNPAYPGSVWVCFVVLREQMVRASSSSICILCREGIEGSIREVQQKEQAGTGRSLLSFLEATITACSGNFEKSRRNIWSG